MEDELFKFIGVRVPLDSGGPNVRIADLAKSLSDEFPDVDAIFEGTPQTIHAALGSLVEKAGPRVLLQRPDDAASDFTHKLIELGHASLTTVADARVALGGSAAIATARSEDSYRWDVYRGTITVLAKHFDVPTPVAPAFALWLVKADFAASLLGGAAKLEGSWEESSFSSLIESVVATVPMMGAGWSPATCLARQPGVGDLLLVKQNLLGYRMGELVAIENVMATEMRLHRISHSEFDEVETQVETESSESTESESTINDRSELKSEISSALSNQWNVHGDVRYSTKFGPATSLSADTGFAFASSQSSTTSAASTFARETTERSLSTLTERKLSKRRTLTRRTRRDLEERRFDNKKGLKHRNGIYRWVESDWEAKLYNYGKRLILEFLIPEPGLWLSDMRKGQLDVSVDIAEPHPPTCDDFDAAGVPSTRPLRPSDLSSSNYAIYAGNYLAQGIQPPPEPSVGISASFQLGEPKDKAQEYASGGTSNTLKVPDGYEAVEGDCSVITWHRKDDLEASDVTVNVSIAGLQSKKLHAKTLLDEQFHFTLPSPVSGTVPIAFWSDLGRGLVGTVRITCVPSQETVEAWQQSTFDQISGAYAQARQIYEARLEEARTTRSANVAENNLNLTHSHIVAELKKHIIGMLNPGAVVSPLPPLGLDGVSQAIHQQTDQPTSWVSPMDSATSDLLSFLEQAIEWPTLQYVTYPYFWTDASRWSDRFSDSFEGGLMGEFLGAGAARVTVAVPMEFAEAMTYYLAFGTPWGGGSAPAPDDDQYVSIAQELESRADDPSGETLIDTWRFSLPANLVILQQDDVLPAPKPAVP